MTRSAPSLGPLGEVTCVSGQTFCLSGHSGQIRPGTDQGIYMGDTRMLSTLLLRVDGREPQVLNGHPLGPGAARFSGCVLVGDSPDPAVLVERRRSVAPDAWSEQVRVTNHSTSEIAVTVEVEAAADFAYIFDVKHGRGRPETAGVATGSGLRFADADDTVHAILRADPAPLDSAPGHLRWAVTLPAQTCWELRLSLACPDEAGDPPPIPIPATRMVPHGLGTLTVTCSDDRFSELIAQSAVDLASLVVRDGEDRFFPAGTPWFLTLFGRDSLWAALMTLPLGTGVAHETLRVLARCQGERHDRVTEEAPGKIIHEIRHGGQVDRGDLPPRYYGSVDATPLFVITLERAWRWGLDPAAVEALLPHAERALGWMRDDGDADGDGFLEYVAHGPRRLANQGWKDSGDGIFFADGALAEPPIALCEVQGYAYRAALAGADLLDAFARPGADAWRAWAKELAERFRAAFWVGADGARFPAIALDGRKRPVDSATSNIGHLLATGILDADESAAVAARLTEPDLDSGWGLRTASTTSPRFNPLSYHGGSVWPHDTAIAVDGLARVGADEAATALLHGLVAASRHFDYRLPELFGGEQRTPNARPLPYPTACRPQAWAAGGALLLLRAVLGIAPDVPGGTLHLRPLRPFPFRRLTLAGMPLAGGQLSLEVHDDALTVTEVPDGLALSPG
jgi:glycogen debranching enzyme